MDKEAKLQAAFRTFFAVLVGWATYAGFIVCLVKWPMRAVALAVFMVATNIHSVGKQLVGKVK